MAVLADLGRNRRSVQGKKAGLQSPASRGTGPLADGHDSL